MLLSCSSLDPDRCGLVSRQAGAEDPMVKRRCQFPRAVRRGHQRSTLCSAAMLRYGFGSKTEPRMPAAVQRAQKG